MHFGFKKSTSIYIYNDLYHHIELCVPGTQIMTHILVGKVRRWGSPFQTLLKFHGPWSPQWLHLSSCNLLQFGFIRHEFQRWRCQLRDLKQLRDEKGGKFFFGGPNFMDLFLVVLLFFKMVIDLFLVLPFLGRDLKNKKTVSIFYEKKWNRWCLKVFSVPQKRVLQKFPRDPITFWEWFHMVSWNLNTLLFGGDCTPQSSSEKVIGSLGILALGKNPSIHRLCSPFLVTSLQWLPVKLKKQNLFWGHHFSVVF